MIKIDNSLLQEVGLGSLPEGEKNAFLKHIYETLEMNVGIRLADQMTNEQLDEFEQYFEAKDDAGAFKWLETNFPNYKEIVQEEFDKLKAEIARQAPQILAATQAQPVDPAAVAPAPAPIPPEASAPQPQPTAPAPAPNPFPNQQPFAAPETSTPAPPAPAESPVPQPNPYEPPFPTEQPPAGPPQQA